MEILFNRVMLHCITGKLNEKTRSIKMAMRMNKVEPDGTVTFILQTSSYIYTCVIVSLQHVVTYDQNELWTFSLQGDVLN